MVEVASFLPLTVTRDLSATARPKFLVLYILYIDFFLKYKCVVRSGISRWQHHCRRVTVVDLGRRFLGFG